MYDIIEKLMSIEVLDPLLFYSEEHLINCREKLIVSKATKSIITTYDISPTRKDYNLYKNLLKQFRCIIVEHYENIIAIYHQIDIEIHNFRKHNYFDNLINLFQKLDDMVSIVYQIDDYIQKIKDSGLEKKLKKSIHKDMRIKTFLYNYINDYCYNNGIDNIGNYTRIDNYISQMIRYKMPENKYDVLYSIRTKIDRIHILFKDIFDKI